MVIKNKLNQVMTKRQNLIMRKNTSKSGNRAEEKTDTL